MDIISGLVAITATFFGGAAITTALVTRRGGDPGVQAPLGLARSVMGTLVVVYFTASSVLLLIAQQYGLAGGNAIVGLILVLLQYAEPAMRGARRPAEAAEDGDTWRR